MDDSMLTTVDNPYNPFTHWDEWYNYDYIKGYHTPSYLARVVRTSESLSDVDQDLAEEMAIDEIIAEDVENFYKKIYATDSVPSVV